MTRLISFFLAFLVLTLAGCLSETSDSSGQQAALQPHPAVDVANRVLTAIHGGDVEAIKSFFNETNRSKIGDEQFAELVAGAREMAGDVRTVSELRHGSIPEIVLAKIRVVDGEVYVLVLELEDGGYRLEDINSPPLVEFEKMKLVQ